MHMHTTRIDHVLLSSDLASSDVSGISNVFHDIEKGRDVCLSDHFGVRVSPCKSASSHLDTLCRQRESKVRQAGSDFPD